MQRPFAKAHFQRPDGIARAKAKLIVVHAAVGTGEQMADGFGPNDERTCVPVPAQHQIGHGFGVGVAIGPAQHSNAR
mgnify:CR=1 FL=1